MDKNVIININKLKATPINKELEKSVNSFIAENSNYNFASVLNCLSSLILSGGKLIVPIDVDLEDMDISSAEEVIMGKTIEIKNDIGLRYIELESGETMLCAFTSYKEADKGGEICTATTDAADILQRTLFSPVADGIVLNPWSGGIILDKDTVRYIFRTALNNKEKEEGFLSFAPETNEINPPSPAKVEKAISFALSRHGGDFRKGTKTPYILHPLSVLDNLYHMDADYDLLAAGVLHDTVEDTETNIEDIHAAFGLDVARLVDGHSEDKRDVWFMRKLQAIDDTFKGDTRLKMLVMADVNANLKSIYNDLKSMGNSLWKRFNAPFDYQAWYYSAMIDAFTDLKDYINTADIYWETVSLYKEIFIACYYDEKNCALYQLSPHGENYVLKKGSAEWKLMDERMSESAVEVNRKFLELMEDAWKEKLI